MTGARKRTARAHASGLLVAAASCAMAVVAGAQAPAPPPFRYGAQVDVESFTYRRDISSNAPGVTELTFDAGVLAHSRPGFPDLRIVAPDGRQVPYIVERAVEPVVVQLPALERDPSGFSDALRRRPPDDRRRDTSGGGRISRYLIRLPYAHLPPARLVLNTAARVFQRRLWLETGPGGDHEHAEADPTIIADTWWSHADPSSDAPPLTFDVGTLRTSTLRLAVDEGDNAALPLGRPSLLLPAYRARFIRPAAALQLVYGNRTVDAPRYDLALQARSLFDLAAEKATVGPERTGRATRFPVGVAFWSALVLAVVVLFGLLARLVRNPAPPGPR